MTKALKSTEAPLSRFWVIGIDLPATAEAEELRTSVEKLEEAVNLTEALSQVEIAGTTSVKLNKVVASTFLGKGKAEEIAEEMAANKVDVAMVNTPLSPSQQRNLELAFNCKVIDRTALILEIFGERARTKAGRLQVALAHQMYQQSRLVRTWTHLERQRGGLGKTGGPGERQIELDRRMIRDRITLIKQDLAAIVKERELQRQKRDKSGVPKVSLVGYTNAGKSTLFNAITNAGTLAKDQLFATLDPLMRRMELPKGQEVVMIDTVGFVSDLPHQLVAAFEATLEEVRQADLLLHVVDGSSKQKKAQINDVNHVLERIGAQDVPTLMVYNKADQAIEKDAEGHWISATHGEGVDALLNAIEDQLQADKVELNMLLPYADGKSLAWLHDHADILEKEALEEGWQLKVRLSADDEARFNRLQNVAQ